ncbi:MULTISPECIES: hypothetical protein [unclassified Curtobacterium]|uniref:hypothetical protein n=1 Tax=unclassified Curtobacterium TaxID=257496 RepID=UPI003A810A09
MTTVTFSGLTFDDEADTGYRLSKLVGWYDAAPARYEATNRPQAHGSFRPGTIYRDPRVVSVEGSWSGTSLEDAYAARNKLAAVQANGIESPFVVADPVGRTSITAGIAKAPTMDDGLYQPYFKFAFDVIAADPFRYGDEVSVSTGVPTPSSGLVWPLGSTQEVYSWTGTAYQSTSVAKVNGNTTRTNYSTHPSAEDGTTTGYTPNQYGPQGALSVSTDRVRTGTRSWKYTAVGGGNGEGVSFSVPAGQRFVSVWVYNPSVGGIDHLGITGITTSQTSVTRTATKDAWVRLSLDMGNTTGGTAVVYNDDTAASAGQVFYWDDVLIGDQGDYFDGGSKSSGAYFNWGTTGITGRVSVTNTGTATTVSTFSVTGGLSGGFELVWVPTGQRIRFERPIDVASAVQINPRTGRVTIDGASDVTGFLTASQWWSVPAGSTGEVQFTPLGTVTGTPTLTARTAPANI